MVRTKDILWVLAYPLYQMIGTLRHEGAHAVAAWLEGAHIKEFVFWPGESPRLGFSWGYVVWEGPTDFFPIAAPYLCDLLVFLAAFWLCRRIRTRKYGVWINSFILGMVSPLVNSGYNYLGGLHSRNDVGKLLVLLPGPLVHAYFWLTLCLYGMGIMYCLLRSKHKKEGE